MPLHNRKRISASELRFCVFSKTNSSCLISVFAKIICLPRLACVATHTSIVRTLKEGQPLRLPLNLLFYHFNHSEPIYKFQRIELLDAVAACNQLNVYALK